MENFDMFGAGDTSECSSGCESGWTLYLQNSNSVISPQSSCNNVKYGDDGGEEEDLSMISDASSGPPPHVVEQDDNNANSHGWFYHDSTTLLLSSKSNVKLQKKKQSRGKKQGSSVLDDTASSPIFNCTRNNKFSINNQISLENVVPDFSQGYSTTQFQGQSAYQHQGHYEFFHSSLIPENQLQQNQWFGGR